MHCKRLILSILLLTGYYASYAQHRMDIPTRVVSVDTIISRMPVKAKLAANLPVKEKGYKKVPLAGQKEYFGDKTDYMTQFMRKYFEAHNQTLNCVKGRGNTQFSLLDNVLEKNKMPTQLKYLAVIESALDHNAVSHAGAVGPWQLMQSTAKLMGLTVNHGRDDRRDWYKSTNAAAKYLSILYGQLNDWLLVIAAYNSGPGPVRRAIARTGSHNFWDIKPYLPHETQGHVLAFIATASIFENLSSFIGLGNIPDELRLDDHGKAVMPAIVNKAIAKKSPFTEEELKNMAIVHLSEPLSMELIAHELGVDMSLLNKWNSDYEVFEYSAYPADYYSLRIPKDKVDNFVQKKEYLAKKSKQIFNDMNL
ncbi:MAG: lytic transglycosylase domain-containing protein [Taibaiella sp.]|nr:lytic transglycosylase domain-containing protein [Taibaiella sp.]